MRNKANWPVSAGSLSITNLSAYYKEDREVISEAITLTLLFRTIGAIIFGIAGDLYGRKFPDSALAYIYIDKVLTFIVYRWLSIWYVAGARRI